MEIVKHEHGYSMQLIPGENEILYDAIMLILNTVFENCVPSFMDRGEKLVIHKEKCGLYWMRVNSNNNRRMIDAFASAHNGFIHGCYPWRIVPPDYAPDPSKYGEGRYKGCDEKLDPVQFVGEYYGHR